jgi:hypothetical protein
MNLPTLPPGTWPYATTFTAKQMKEYATAAVLAERERCAAMFDEVARDTEDQTHLGKAFWCRAAADAIRSQSGSEPTDVRG